MSQRIRKNIHFLLLLRDTHKAQQRVLLRTISSEQLKAIGEIALNILEGVIPLRPSQKGVLSRYKNAIRLIGQKSVSDKRKKATLLKNSKVLGILINTVTPLLKSL